MGRRQQRRLPRARRRRRLRAQRGHQHAPAQGGHRGDHDRRLRARPRPRRLALHDLPDRARRPTERSACTTCATAASSRRSTSAATSCCTCCALSQALKTAKYAGNEVPAAGGQGDRADLREDARRAPAARSRSPPSTRARTSPTSTRPARRWATRSRSPTPRRCSAACSTRSSTAARPRRTSRSSPRHAGVPVYNGLTDEWHPTQMLADFLTMHERAAQALRRDRVRVRRRRPLQHGPLAAGHRRDPGLRRAPRHAPGAAAAGRRRRDGARARGRPPARTITITDDVAAGVTGVDFVHTDVWVSMGEPKDVWARARAAARPLPGQRGAARRDGQPARSSSCTACRRSTTASTDGRRARSPRRPAWPTASRSPTRSSASPASIVFDQAENRLHTIKAVLVATLAERPRRIRWRSSRWAATPCSGGGTSPRPRTSSGPRGRRPEHAGARRRVDKARGHSRQRPTGGAALALKEDAYGEEAVPARHPRRRDRGSDRLRGRVGAGQCHPASGHGHGRDASAGRRRGPGVRASDQVHRPGVRRAAGGPSSPTSAGGR